MQAGRGGRRGAEVNALIRVVCAAVLGSGLCVAKAQAPTLAPRSGGAPVATAIPAENCQLSVSEPDLDYGPMTRYRLEEGGNAQDLSLGKRRMTINVSCQVEAKIGVRFRGSSVGADYVFGTAGGKQGKVTLTLVDSQLDGRRVLVGAADAAGMVPAAPASSARFMPGQVLVPVEGGQPVSGKQFSAAVEIDPSVPKDAARVRSRTSLETHGTFEVIWR